MKEVKQLAYLLVIGFIIQLGMMLWLIEYLNNM